MKVNLKLTEKSAGSFRLACVVSGAPHAGALTPSNRGSLETAGVQPDDTRGLIGIRREEVVPIIGQLSARFMDRSRFWNRGADRRSSKNGSTFKATSQFASWSYALSSAARALSVISACPTSACPPAGRTGRLDQPITGRPATAGRRCLFLKMNFLWLRVSIRARG